MTRKNITLKDFIESDVNKSVNEKGKAVGLTVEDFLQALKEREGELRKKSLKLHKLGNEYGNAGDKILNDFIELSKDLENDLNSDYPKITFGDIENKFGQGGINQVHDTVIDAKYNNSISINSSEAQIIARRAQAKHKASQDPTTLSRRPSFAEEIRKDSEDLVNSIV